LIETGLPCANAFAQSQPGLGRKRPGYLLGDPVNDVSDISLRAPLRLSPKLRHLPRFPVASSFHGGGSTMRPADSHLISRLVLPTRLPWSTSFSSSGEGGR
jgi:hypothetical protein